VRKALRQLRSELRADEGAHVDLALFRSSDPEVLAEVAAVGLGAASIGAPSMVTGQAIDAILKALAPSARERRGLFDHSCIRVGRAASAMSTGPAH